MIEYLWVDQKDGTKRSAIEVHEGLRSAASGAFKRMGWDQIEAQSRKL
jgi:hypothetical protein